MKIMRHTVPNILNFTSNLLMLFFVQPLSRNSVINCRLQSIVTCTFIQTFDQNVVFFSERRHVDRQCDVLFSASGLKDEKLRKSRPTRKLKHTNSILEYFDYFCQIWSKLILIILSYTVSKLTHFLDTVYYMLYIMKLLINNMIRNICNSWHI